MFYQMQDIAWEHAGILGFGFHHLKEKNQFWVLSRILIRITRYPEWAEDFTLETWSRGTDGFFGYRDFDFRDQNGNSIIQATSNWLVLDLNTKRIVRLSDFNEFPNYSESVFSENAGKVNPVENTFPLRFTPAQFSEIDINQHFNSGRYIERMIDYYDFSFHEQNELCELEINFLKEGISGDSLAIKQQIISEQVHICSVVRESDYADLIRAKLVWRNK
jgi:acyl-ACP thioesterase